MRGLIPSIVFFNLAVLEKKIYRFLSSRCEKKRKEETVKSRNSLRELTGAHSQAALLLMMP